MRIVDVTTAVVAYHGEATLVRIDTDEGLSGFGEANPDAGAGAVVGMIDFLRAELIGEDPRNVERCWEKLRRRKVFAGPQAGVFVIALSGIELALWDLAGKAAGQPVYRLLGGKFRDRIRLYADCGDGDDPAGSVVRAASTGPSGWSREGFTALKFDIDDLHHPAKFDAFNHTVNAAELRIDGRAGRRRPGGDRPGRRPGHRPARPLRRAQRLPDRLGAGAVRPDVAGGAAAGGEHRRAGPGPRPDPDADLRRGEPVPALGLPRAARSAAPSTSSSRTSPSAAAWPRPRRSPTSPRCTTCRSRRTWCPPRWARWPRRTSAPRSRTSTSRNGTRWRSARCGTATCVAPDGSGSIVKDGYITLPDTPGIGVELDMDGVRSTPCPDYGIYKGGRTT